MPEPESSTALDVRLARGRADLLDRIDQPPLDRIHRRTAARRRRRHTVGGGLLLAVAVAAGLVIRPWAGGVEPVPPPVADAPAGPVYADAGITINGLGPAGVPHLPGTISDVEFTDPDHGFLLSQCPVQVPCPASVAWTEDGGGTWQSRELPAGTGGQPGLDLLVFDGDRLLVTGEVTYGSVDGGRTWQAAADAAGPGPGDLLRRAESGGCGGPVQAWRAGSTTPRLADPPGFDVCWLASAATVDGGWWAGGIRAGQPALATTRDGGVTWQQVPLPGSPDGVASVEFSVLGRHAYVALLGADRTVLGLLHSADGGLTFGRTGDGAALPAGLTGTLVPLLDGRLLATGTDQRWYVSDDDGRSFTRAEGNLPAVGRLTRTAAGYVAYDLFGAGWAAYSADGSTWRKLQIN